MKFILTGDTHGQVETRIKNIVRNMNIDINEPIGVIILGDTGLNFYLNKTDEENKKKLAQYGFYIYCVRGNHEERPENLNYQLFYDENVQGEVYLDPINNSIRYFKDGNVYNLEGHRTLVIGGAYSVDKWYRLRRAAMMESSFTGWFKDEQLSIEEMKNITNQVNDQSYDFILSHTCPISWEPIDLFINVVDQSKVDKSMEIWLDAIKFTFSWKIWCFGHYHADRLERPRVQMFYQKYEWLNDVWNRWEGERTIRQDCLIPKSPLYYAEV